MASKKGDPSSWKDLEQDISKRIGCPFPEKSCRVVNSSSGKPGATRRLVAVVVVLLPMRRYRRVVSQRNDDP